MKKAGKPYITYILDEMLLKIIMQSEHVYAYTVVTEQ